MTFPNHPLFWIVRLNWRRAANPPAPVSVARFAAGRPAKKTNGSAPAGTNGIRSTREESAQPACTSGLKRSASHVADGQRTRSGTRSDSGEEVEYEDAKRNQSEIERR